jgi:hypothetical protein
MRIKIPKEEKEKIENVFKERECFINSLVDKNTYGWVCPVHNVTISKNIKECPLCELEKAHRIKYKSDGDDDLASPEKRERERERKRREYLDPIKKAKQLETAKQHRLKERKRKKEHSLSLDV